MRLCILDASNFIYAGSFANSIITRGAREVDGEFVANSAPIGGVKFLLNKVIELTDENTTVIPVFDRPPEIKRKMYKDTIGTYETYKGTRKKGDRSIYLQSKYAEEVLRDLGYPVQSADGYEADDIIYTLVQIYHDDYDKIEVYERDSDLRFLVDPKVTMMPVIKTDKMINIFNYESNARNKDYTHYNTVHLKKLCAGDVSDNIPGVGWKWAELLDEILTEDDYRKLGDLDFARKKLIEVVNANPGMQGGHKLVPMFNIICPLRVPADLIEDDYMDVDDDKLAYYAEKWKPSLDKWNLEDMLREYIESYYD